jgi:hypothetical protein
MAAELLSAIFLNGKLILTIKSVEKLTLAIYRGEPFPLEPVEKSGSYFIYRVSIQISSESFDGGEVTVYTVKSSKQILNIPPVKSKKEIFEFSRIPSVIYIVGTKEFGNVVLRGLGNQFENAEILDEWPSISKTEKSGVLVFEKVDFEDLETFSEFLRKISKRFEFCFILFSNTNFQFPLIIPSWKIPDNVSFVALKNVNKSFFEDVKYIDLDQDGWIEASEISNKFDGILFHDTDYIPFIRSSSYPILSDEVLKEKLKGLIFEKILDVGDLEKCVEVFKKGIAPPWLNEYLIGKIGISDLKNLKKLYFW